VINCSASEVAAMVEGAMRHGTSMAVDGNYVDSHGQSEVGFYAHHRKIARDSSALIVRGRLERANGVTNLVADRLERLSPSPRAPHRETSDNATTAKVDQDLGPPLCNDKPSASVDIGSATI
jgi:Tn3 transposase DDE domain